MDNSKTGSTANRQKLRLLKVLYNNRHETTSLNFKGEVACVTTHTKQHRFPSDLIIAASDAEEITRQNSSIKITSLGEQALKALLNPEAEARDYVTTRIEHDGESRQVTVNLAESPLLRLYNRRTKAGERYFSKDEVQAGERLRKDFERGRLQPKISASLTTVAGSGGSRMHNGGEISDFAMDARSRLNRAVDVLGPDLSGVTLDICCFLKGFEAVERERSWPPRSAKLMLKTALSLLSRHYGLTGFGSNRSGGISTWGAEGYRPEISYG